MSTLWSIRGQPWSTRGQPGVHLWSTCTALPVLTATPAAPMPGLWLSDKEQLVTLAVLLSYRSMPIPRLFTRLEEWAVTRGLHSSTYRLDVSTFCG